MLGLQLVQVVSLEAPVAVEYLPAPHAMQAVSAAAPAVVRYLPTPQLVHVLTKVAPVAVEYLPAAQSVHAAEPIASLYFPATQTAHVPPFGPEYPRLQRQAETAVCPEADVTEYAGQATQVISAVAPTVAENALAAQLVHAAEPEPALYFPATHNTHAAPSDPVAPVLQVQAVSTADPGGEFEFAGQTSQVGLPSADHPPAEHCWHVSAPVAPTAAE